MLLNTYEHGYTDALSGRQCVLGSEDYRAGYRQGKQVQARARAAELAGLAIVAVAIGAVLCLTVAQAAGAVV